MDQPDRGDQVVRAIGRRLQNGDVLVIGRNVDETREISRVVGQALALGLLPAFCLCLLAGASLNVRAQKWLDRQFELVLPFLRGCLR